MSTTDLFFRGLLVAAVATTVACGTTEEVPEDDGTPTFNVPEPSTGINASGDPWENGVASFGFDAGFVFDADENAIIEWTFTADDGSTEAVKPYLVLTFGNGDADWNNANDADFCSVVYEWAAPITAATWAAGEGAYFGYDLDMAAATRDDSDCAAIDATGSYAGYADLMTGVWKVSLMPLTAEMATTIEQAGPPITTSAVSAKIEYAIEGMPELDAVLALGTALNADKTDFEMDAAGDPALIPAADIPTGAGLATGFYQIIILNVIGLG